MQNLESEIKEAIKLTQQVIDEREAIMPEDLTGMTRSLKKQVKELEGMLEVLVRTA